MFDINNHLFQDKYIHRSIIASHFHLSDVLFLYFTQLAVHPRVEVFEGTVGEFDEDVFYVYEDLLLFWFSLYLERRECS